MFTSALLALALSASTPVPVQLQVGDFQPELEGHSTVEIKASAPLLTLGEGSVSGLLHSEPELPWVCQFVDEQAIDCSTDHALPVASNIQLLIAPGLLMAQDGAPVLGLDARVQSALAELEVWELGRDARGLPNVLVYSQQPLREETLTGRVWLLQGEGQWPFDFRPVSDELTQEWIAQGGDVNAAKHVWQLQWPETIQPGTSVQLVAEAGVEVVGGQLATTEDITIKQWSVPERLEFVIACANWWNSECSYQDPLELRVNTQPTSEVLAELSAVLPQGMRLLEQQPKWRQGYAERESYLAWPIQLDAPARSYRMKIPAHWRGMLGQKPRASELLYTSGMPRQELQISQRRQLFPLDAVDSRAVLEWRNLPKFGLLHGNLGHADFALLESRRFVERDPLVVREYSLPRLSRRMRTAGGTTWGTTYHVDGARGRRTEFVGQFGRAYADVGLHALVFSNQIQLLATDLYSAQVLPNVHMELLRTEFAGLEQARSQRLPLRQLHRGITDTAGQVQLNNSSGTQWMRARRDSRVTVLPLLGLSELQRDQSRSSSYDVDPAGLLWTERMVYRPGEVVQFRLFVREYAQRQLAPPALDERERYLVLFGDNSDQPMAHLPVRLDQFGAASGSWTIPDSARDADVTFEVHDSVDDYIGFGSPAFRIASVDPAALDVQLEIAEGGITPTQLPVLELRAGYFSGGPAAQLEAVVHSVLQPAYDSGLQQSFPEFVFQSAPNAADDAAEKARFEAALGCMARQTGSGPLSSGEQKLPPTDAAGKSAVELRLPTYACAMGEIEITPKVRGVGQPWTYGLTQRRAYSRDPLILGIKAPSWLASGSAVDIEAAVVRTADLSAVAQEIDVSIEHFEQGRWTAVHACRVGARSPSRCSWRPVDEGQWRIVAHSEGLAPVKHALWIWGSAPKEAQATLDGPEELLVAGTSISYRLRQPYVQARVLLSVEGGGVLHQQWYDVAAAETQLPLLIQAHWAPCFVVSALIVPVTERGTPLQSTLAAAAENCLAVQRKPLIELHVLPLSCTGSKPQSCMPEAGVAVSEASAASGQPGSWVRVQVRSLHERDLSLSITAIDAALFDLVPELREQRDPHSGAFLQREWTGGTARTYSLQSWANAAPTELQTLHLSSGFYGGAFRHRGTRLTTDGDDESLDMVTVTGTRIVAFENDTPPSHGRRPERSAEAGRATIPERWRAVLRQNFAESAVWLPFEYLAAGSTRHFDVRLPDNLTRWQFQVLAADARDQFELAQASITAGLPLEARASAPTRVFVGDRSVLSAELRNASGEARQVQGRLALLDSPQVVMRTARLLPNSSTRLELPWNPQSWGRASVLAGLEDPATAQADAVLRGIQIESRYAPWTQRQTGLLAGDRTELDLARLLEPGSAAHLRLQFSRNPLFGLAGLFDQMRDYPHRCLEQRLSRALVAFHAQSLGALAQTDISWASAAVIDDPLRNLSRHRDADDQLVYFNPDYESGSAELASYALLVMAELGQQLPEPVQENALEAAGVLVKDAGSGEFPGVRKRSADLGAMGLHALARHQVAKAEQLERILAARELLSAWGLSHLAQALDLQQDRSEQREDVVRALRARGVVRGNRIVLPEDSERSSWLGSDARDACAVLGALLAADHSADAHQVQASWLLGIFDAYGNDLPQFDTQAMASCSGAARAYAQRWLQSSTGLEPVQLSVRLDVRVVLDAALPTDRPLALERSLGTADRPRMSIRHGAQPGLTFDVSLTQQRDLLQLPAAAQGLAVTRTAEVWRDGTWLAVPQAKLYVGDWLRVRLLVRSPQPVDMVALTDVVPGGLRAIDKTLEGVSDAQVQAADEGSFWFFERQLSTTHARFYATQLPGGAQEVIYYTQARHAGRYAWPGARAELMYALQRYGRSAATVLEIAPANAAP